MSNDFFKAAVVGPLASRLLSVVASCAECVAAQDPKSAEPCAGFGSGCLAKPSRPSAPETAEDLDVRLTLRREIL